MFAAQSYNYSTNIDKNTESLKTIPAPNMIRRKFMKIQCIFGCNPYQENGSLGTNFDAKV